MKKIKNITLILTIIFILTGCNYDKIVAPLPSNDKIDDTIKEPTYTDNNPIKLGIFLSNNNYYNKMKIYFYSASRPSRKHISEVFQPNISRG